MSTNDHVTIGDIFTRTNVQPPKLLSFTPIVTIDDSKDGKNLIYSVQNCSSSRKEVLMLSNDFDQDKRQYIVAELIISKKDKSIIPLKVIQGYNADGWLQDKEGIVEFICSNAQVTINPTKIKVSHKDEINIEITHTLSRGESFVIDIKGKDNPDDVFVSPTVVKSGKLKVSIVENDVFLRTEYDKMLHEINYIVPFVNAESPSEYIGNYCMSAAERALSKLLSNTSDFYSVDRSHKRLNKIGFSGKGAKDRGKVFKRSGFTESDFIFDQYQINHALRKQTKNINDYHANKYSIITLAKGSSLFTYLSNSIRNKMGYHVYYISVSNDFHTLILLIDNSEPCKKKYVIYDQHGDSSSQGNFSDIEAGFARQTSWTFLNQYRNSGYKPDLYSKVTTRLWKIQRK